MSESDRETIERLKCENYDLKREIERYRARMTDADKRVSELRREIQRLENPTTSGPGLTQ